MEGYIKVEGKDQKTPKFKILFNGSDTSNNKEGFFAFTPPERHETYSIVICSAIERNYEGVNTIDSISLPPGKRSRVVTISSTESEDGSHQIISDVYQEKSDGSLRHTTPLIDGRKTIDPEKTIILLLDPQHVSRIEPWNITLPDGFIKLPRIVLKNKSSDTTSALSTETLEQASAKSLLAALDMAPFHEPCKGSKRKIAKGKIKLAVIP